MNVIPGSMFRDCTPGDFEHYFVRTLLLWNLSPTKKRLFLCEGLSNDSIKGQYLTRQKELKEKWFTLSNWWQSLDILPPYGITFSLGKSACLWYPSMAKYLKKSFPTVESSVSGSLTFLGSPKAGEVTIQNILASAFSKYYSPLSLPDLKEAISLKEYTGVAAAEGFAIDFVTKAVWLKNSRIGTWDEFNKNVVVDTALAKEILVDVGHVPAERVVVQ